MIKEDIYSEIERLVLGYRQIHQTITSWRKPLVGFASAGDPLFRKLGKAVSPGHLLPRQLLPGARTVIAFFIPFGKTIGRSNIRGKRASEKWVRAYIETNALIESVGAHMQRTLGVETQTVAVTPATHNFDKVKLISDWSHRHIAFIAGLGRFGVNNMLITDSGCCGRFGSFVTTLDMEPDVRPEAESCLYRHDASCLTCVDRCPHGALFSHRFHRSVCYGACLWNEEHFRSIGVADVCGKCLVGLPCTFINPIKSRYANAVEN